MTTASRPPARKTTNMAIPCGQGERPKQKTALPERARRNILWLLKVNVLKQNNFLRIKFTTIKWKSEKQKSKISPIIRMTI